MTETDSAGQFRFFGDDLEAAPTHRLTQGAATIMEARHLILVATGRKKAEAVHQLVEGAVSALWPATVLQHHPPVTVLVDEPAACRLQLVDYYRETYRYKPRVAGHLSALDRRLTDDRPRVTAAGLHRSVRRPCQRPGCGIAASARGRKIPAT